MFIKNETKINFCFYYILLLFFWINNILICLLKIISKWTFGIIYFNEENLSGTTKIFIGLVNCFLKTVKFIATLAKIVALNWKYFYVY